ncbi:MAG: PAS domain S-box protein [Candidatus Delongbacteria bacterium]|nr:PAS domain S-box protein [Candidatus Delongbacteria bacterium]MBN2835573.1 PAS domain S-box protein [Candidatus Delongbacteria bacterium]
MNINIRICKKVNLIFLILLICTFFNSLEANVKVRLQLKWEHQFQFAGYYAAIEKGFYKNEGLEVDLILPEKDKDPVLSMIENDIEFGVGNSEIMLMRNKGFDIVVLGVIFQHSPLVLITRNSLNNANIGDITNKVMIEHGASEIFAYLDKANVKVDNIYNDLDTALDYFVSGKIDAFSAYITDEPFILDSLNIDYSIIHPTTKGIDFYGDNIFTSEKYLKDSPQIVEKFLKASLEGWDYAMRNKNEIIDLILNKYSKRHSLEHLKYESDVMTEFLHSDLIYPGYMTKKRWSKILETYLNLGMIRSDFSLEDFMYNPSSKNSFLKNFLIQLLISLSIIVPLTLIIIYIYRINVRLKHEINVKLKIEEDKDTILRKLKLLQVGLEQSPISIVITDNHGNIQYVNQKFIEVSGYSFDEVFGRNPRLLKANYFDNEYYKNLWSTINRGDNWQGLLYNQTKKGNFYWESATISPIKNDEETITHFLAVKEDITEKRAMENRLIENELKYKTLFYETPDPYLILQDNIFIECNYSAEKILKVNKKEIVGRSPVEFSPIYQPNGEKSESYAFKMINIASQKGTNTFEWLHKRTDGTEFYVEVTLSRMVLKDQITFFVIWKDIEEIKKAQMELYEKKNLLSDLIENSGALIYVKDLEGKYKIVNREWEKVIGLSREVTLGKDDFQLFEAIFANDFVNNDKTVISTGKILKKEEVLFKDEEEVHFLSIKFPLRDVNNNIYGICGISTNISDRKIIEQKLRESEERYRLLFETSQEGIMVGQNFKVVYFNPVIPIITGYSPEELYDMNFLDLVHKDDVKTVYDNYNKRISGNVIEQKYRIRIIMKDGTISWIAISGVYFEWEGEPATLNFIEDVTKMKIIEDALIENEEKYRLLTEFTSDVIWILNLNRECFTYISPSVFQLRGLTVEEAMNESLDDSLHKDSIEYVKERINEGLKTFLENPNSNKYYHDEVRQYHKDGTLLWIEVATQFRFNNLNEIEIVGVSRNINDRKAMEFELIKSKEEAEKANKAKSEFLANMSHEFRTPLNAILGFSNNLLSLVKDEKQRSSLHSIKKSGSLLLTLVNDILDLSKVEAGKLTFHFAKFSTKSFIDDIVQVFKMRAEDKKLDFQIEIDSEFPEFIIFDELRIHQVLTNLLSNAFKFTDEGFVKLKLSFFRFNGTLKVEVQDSGIGIKETELDRIFIVFEQQSGQDSKKYEGTGLGLSITKKIVELLNGKISVQSKFGEGSIFIVEFLNIEYSGVTESFYNDSNPESLYKENLYLFNKNEFDFSSIGNKSKVVEIIREILIPESEIFTRVIKIDEIEKFGIKIGLFADTFNENFFTVLSKKILFISETFNVPEIKKIPVYLDKIANLFEEKNDEL